MPTRDWRREPQKRVEIELDGRSLPAVEGETLLAALLVAGGFGLGLAAPAGGGAFCGMGCCMGCLVHVEGLGAVRACMTAVRAGMICWSEPPGEDAG